MIGPTGTITFLFTDIQGSTRLWEQYPQAMPAVLARHDELLRRAIETHAGFVFKTVGDAFCAAFSIAADALLAALDAQRAIHTETWGEIGPLLVRMALHSGAAEARGGDYFGPSLNRVARLLAVGHGGQILLSLATAELVQDHLPKDLVLRGLGEHRLKDLVRPERICQLVAPDLPAEFPPLCSLDGLPNNLPLQLTSFIGRTREISEIEDLLLPAWQSVEQSLASPARLVTLVGAGGAGKTRLALQVAAEVIEAFRDGVWFVELAPLANAALVPQTVAAAFGLRERGGRSLADLLTDYLRDKRLLLVLDNCEHLAPACAQLADMLLRVCPNLQILATSREALGTMGETIYTVPSLLRPDLRDLPPLPALSQYEAVRLFIDRALAVLPTFTVTNENAPALAQICHRLDGIPLAIELAAARVKAMTVQQIAARLDDRFRLLTGGNRAALPRQQTLRALVDWSYDLLTEAERTLLRRLAVFAGGWTLEAAEAVAGDQPAAADEHTSGVPVADVLDLLGRLVNKSLVTVERLDNNQMRYGMLETIRQYALEKLAAAGETEEMHRRHLHYYLQMVEATEAQFYGVGQLEWLNRMETEHDNIRVALAWAAARNPLAGMRLAGGAALFWWVRGYLSEGRKWLGLLLALPDAGRLKPDWPGLAARAKILQGAAWLARLQSDTAAARPPAEEARDLCRELRDKRGEALALRTLAFVALDQSDVSLAFELGRASLELFRAAGDKWGQAEILSLLSHVAMLQNDYMLAERHNHECLVLRRAIGDKIGLAWSHYNLAELADVRGDYGEALRLCEVASDLFAMMGDRWGWCVARNYGAFMAFLLEDYPQARKWQEESLAVSRTLGDRNDEAWALLGLGMMMAHEGETEAARQNLRAARDLFRECGHKAGLAEALRLLGELEWNTGEAAAALIREGARVALTVENVLELARAWMALARLAQGQQQFALAVKLAAAAARRFAATGASMFPRERAWLEDFRRTMVSEWGRTAFEAAWNEGQALTQEQAMALVEES